MAHLAVVGSHSTNGVAAIHTQLLKSRVLGDFHEMFPQRFNNKTNGVTPRRWLQQANPHLSELITRTIGPAWTHDLAQLHAGPGWTRHRAEPRDEDPCHRPMLAPPRAAEQGLACGLGWLLPGLYS